MKYVVQILVAAAAVVGVILVLDRYGKKWLKKIQDCRCRIFGDDNICDEDDFLYDDEDLEDEAVKAEAQKAEAEPVEPDAPEAEVTPQDFAD